LFPYIGRGTTHGNSLCNYLYLKLAKHHISCFNLIFYVFSSTTLEKRRQKRFCRGMGVGVWGVWLASVRWEVVGSGNRRVHMV
jgi:hypothetical protein